MRLTMVLVLLLAVSGIVFADGCDVVTKLDFAGGNPTQIDVNWKTWSVLGILASFGLLSITYMFGIAIGSQPLISRSKEDLTQTIVTAVMLVVIASVLGGICSFKVSEIGMYGATVFDGAKGYFGYAKGVALNAYTQTAGSIMYTSAAQSMFVQSKMNKILSLYYRPFIGLGSTIGPMEFVMSIVFIQIIVAHGQLILLSIIENNLFNLLFPAGLIMRCFTPTREFGGTIMAIAIGLFFFFPFLFSLNYMLVGNIQAPAIESPDWQSLIIGIGSGAALANPFYIANLNIGLITILTLIAVILTRGQSEMAAALFTAGDATLSVFILPGISWIILGALVRQLSTYLGEEVDISGLARLV